MPTYHCTLTPTQQQIQQYYSIRKRVYRTRMQIRDYQGLPDDLDNTSIFLLIADEQQQCVGGALLHYRTPEHDVPLPVERFEVNLLESLTGLLPNKKYGEAIRLIVDIDHPDKTKIFKTLVEHVVEYFQQHIQCDALFIHTSKPHARMYNNIIRSHHAKFILQKTLSESLPQPFPDNPSYLYMLTL